MVRSAARTVQEYLDELPGERRAEIGAVREVILRNLPDGYRESIGWGMITYCVPLERYPTTYNGQPLGYAALAAQKTSNSLYLMGVYADPAQEAELREGFRAAGKKLDMGKSCVRFRRAADLPLETIGRLIASTGVEQYIAVYEAARKKA